MTREGLESLRARALRRRVWFGVLTRLERGVIDLTIRLVDRIRSARLGLVVGRIVCKLLKALRSGFMVRVERVGSDLAERVSRIAVSWGYADASSWVGDLGFVRYLGISAVNNISGWDKV